MNQTIQNKIKDKIQEDISPTRNLSGVHLKIVFGIAILWTLFQLWYASVSYTHLRAHETDS